MARPTKIDIFNLAGGQNSKSSPIFLKDNECELVQNYHLDNLGSLTKRNGILYLIGQLVDNKSILGMYLFSDQQGTDYSNVLVASDIAAGTSSTISKITTNAWANSKTLDTTGAQPIFCSFIDYVFRTNGTEVMGSSADLTNWGTTNCLATLKPKYTCVWEDRVYALNDNSATKYPSRIYWSSLPSGTPLALTWNAATQYADINPDDNDQITWGEPLGSIMLVFKENAIYRWTFGQVEPDKIISVGTPEGRTVKQTQGICFFTNKYGVYAFDGQTQPILISRKVQPFIDAIPTLTNMRAEVDNDHYYLYIGDVTVKGETYNNTMLVYTISAKAWHIETYPFEIKSMARFQRKTLGTTEIYESIYLGDDDGFVYRKDTGTSDYLGTAAKPIDGRILTKEYPLPNFPKTSILKNLYFLTQKAIGSKVNYRLDRGNWEAWKDLKERVTDGRLSGRARTAQFSITDYSEQTSQIEGLSVEVEAEKGIRREEQNG